MARKRKPRQGLFKLQSKPTGLAWVDSLSWLAKAGQPWIAGTPEQLVKAGHVKAVDAWLDGKQIKVFVHSKFDPAKKLPHSIACSSVKSGRIETRLVSDGRNKPLLGKVTFTPPKAEKKPAKVESKPAKKPAKS